MDKFLKNIEHEKVLELGQLVECRTGQIVSRTLVQNSAVGITLFAFDKGEQISEHESKGDALLTVIEGAADITIGDKVYRVAAGQSAVMPAGIPHAVYAAESFKMMLTVVFPY